MNRLALVILILSFVATGCGGNRSRTVPVSAEPVMEDASGADTSGTGESEGGTGIIEDFGSASDIDLSKDTVYFAFDQANVRPEYMDIVENYVNYLTVNPGRSVRLEGHADERGSREYNIGLGERRAQALRNIMRLRGVDDSQISTVSYGEERPEDNGHDETAWQANRRVQIVKN